MSPVCKMADDRRLTVDQKVKVVLFHAETKSVVATQSGFRANFGTRWALANRQFTVSLRTIFQPMRINSVPDVKSFCNNKNVLCVQLMVWHFVCHSVYIYILEFDEIWDGYKFNTSRPAEKHLQGTKWENMVIVIVKYTPCTESTRNPAHTYQIDATLSIILLQTSFNWNVNPFFRTFILHSHQFPHFFAKTVN